MTRSRWSILAATFVALAASNGFAAEKVGEAVLIKTEVRGDGGTLVTRSPVHRDERIRTSSSGLGEFIFQDGTKFAVGANSSVVIDQFVFNDSRSVKNLTISAAKGSFRWISGGSPSSAYKINTPAGTVGIRGTVVDIFVGAGGKTAVVLLKGQARFCGSNGCQELTKRCDCVVATPGGGVSSPQRVSTDTIAELGSPRALPFISGHQRLSGRFRTGGCQLSASFEKSRSQKQTRASRASAPDTPDPPDAPDPPGKDHHGKDHHGKDHHGKDHHGKDHHGKGHHGKSHHGKGNNGQGNGGRDGSPNGHSDDGR